MESQVAVGIFESLCKIETGARLCRMLEWQDLSSLCPGQVGGPPTWVAVALGSWGHSKDPLAPGRNRTAGLSGVLLTWTKGTFVVAMWTKD